MQQFKEEQTMSNRHLFELTISGIDANELSVLQFHSKAHALSQDYQFIIEAKVPKDYASKSLDLIHQEATLILWENHPHPNPHFIHGIITEYAIHQAIGLDSISLSLTLSSLLHSLSKTNPKSRIFVKKSIPEIISRVLNENNIPNETFKICLPEEVAKEPFLELSNEENEKHITCRIQVPENFSNDLEFLIYELSQHNLEFTFIQGEREPLLIIFDPNEPPEQLKTPVISLEYIPPKGMTNPPPSILSYTQITELSPHGIKQSIKAISNKMGLIPGQIVHFIAHEAPSLRGDLTGYYLIHSIEQAGDNRRGFPEWIGNPENQQTLDYYNTLILHRIDRIEHQDNIESRKSSPASFTHMRTNMIVFHKAHIETINNQGKYHIRFLFDQSDTQQGEASPATPLLQPYAGNLFGTHFPLCENTPVIVGFRKGDGTTPIVFGVLSDNQNPSPVTPDEPFIHRFRSYGDNVLEISDLKNKEYISLHTRHYHHQILLDAQSETPKIQVEVKVGDLKIEAEESQFFTIQNTLRIRSKSTKALIEQQKTLQVEDGDMVLYAKKSIHFKAHQDQKIKTNHFNINVSNSFKIQANYNIYFKALQKLEITNLTHPIEATAKNIKILAKNSGTLGCVVKGSSLLASNNHVLQLKADHICLKAKNLIIPSSFESSN